MSTDIEERSEDSRLVQQIQEGDTGAYRQLVEKYQARIYSLIAGMVRDREEAQDLTQDAFVKAFKNLDRDDAEKMAVLGRIGEVVPRAVENMGRLLGQAG